MSKVIAAVVQSDEGTQYEIVVDDKFIDLRMVGPNDVLSIDKSSWTTIAEQVDWLLRQEE